MSLHKARIKAFEDILEKDIVNIEQLQKLAFNGVPDEKGLRSFVWKVLLHYIPLEKSAWETTLQKKRQLYRQLINEIIVSPGGPTDHPLNLSPDSSWSTYFKDNEVLLQIDKDVRRLCPDISFFQSATEFPCSEIVNSNGVKRLHKRVEQSVLKYSTLERRGLGVAKLSNEIRRSENITSGDYTPLNEGCEAHWEVVERMLFLYAKLNPGQGYVQGMNEIIGPIYHTFASDCNVEYRKHAEADCFFCFTNLMAEIRDFFIRTLDETESGINYMMSKLCECVKKNDRAVWDRLERQELRPQYYSFRWLTLLLSQEFSLPDVERIWDSLFADPQRFNSLIYICCAMILLVRDNILNADFASNVKLLQNFPPMDVSLILKKAVEISSAMAKDLGGPRYDPNTEAFQSRAQWKKVDNCRKQWIERWSWLLDERKQAQNEADAIRQEVAAVLPHVTGKLESTKSLKPVPIVSSGIIGWLAAKPDCQLEIYTSWISKIPLKLPDAWDDKNYV